MFGTFRLADESDRSDDDDDDAPRFTNETVPTRAVCANCIPVLSVTEIIHFVDCTGYHGLECDICHSRVSDEDINKHRQEVMESIPDSIDGQSHNAERCVFIAKAINAGYEGRFDDIESTLSDMLADTMHLCVLTGLDIDQVFSSAKANFLEEFRRGGMARFRVVPKEQPFRVVLSGPPVITHSHTEELEPAII